MDVANVDKIVNLVPEGWNVIAVAVPTRALRVVVEDNFLKFRVEQLDPTNWAWRVISTHIGDEAWESLMPAMVDMVNKQTRLKEKIKLAQHEKRIAMIKAENPLG
jgi:hypothetical protein